MCLAPARGIMTGPKPIGSNIEESEVALSVLVYLLSLGWLRRSCSVLMVFLLLQCF